MAIWADGDAISPDNMNNQHVSALTISGSVSMISETAALPSDTSGQGYLYVSDIGALFWVGGSGSSTTLGAA